MTRQTISQAVAERDAAPAPVPARVTHEQMFTEMFRRRAPHVKAVIPQGVDATRFANMVAAGVKASPDLLECLDTEDGEVSLMLAVMNAATLGLDVNTPLHEAYLEPRNAKDKRTGKWHKECRLGVEFRGLLKLCRRSGNIESVKAEVVREGDEFEWGVELDRDVLHWKPGPEDTRGEMTHAFAIVRYKAGGYEWHVMDRKAIEKRRDMADSWKNEKARPWSPWTKWPEEMWAKTVLRYVLDRADRSADIVRALTTDEARLEIVDGEIIPAGYEADHPDAIETGEAGELPPASDEPTAEQTATAKPDGQLVNVPPANRTVRDVPSEATK